MLTFAAEFKLTPKPELMSFFSSFRRRLAFLLSLCFLVSCVDDGYDLSDLDTDHLYAGDHWTLPLGTGIISAAEILDVKNNADIITDANGDYVARYSNTIYAAPQEAPGLSDNTYSIGSATVPVNMQGGEINLPVNINGELPVAGNQYVTKFLRAEFNTSPTTSLMVVSLDMDATVTGGTAVFDIELPTGFEIDDTILPAGVSGTGNAFRWAFEMNGLQNYLAAIPVRVIDIEADQDVTISGNVNVPSTGSVSSGSQVGFGFDIGFTALDYTVIYGIFDLDFNFTPTSASIGSLYDIFEGDDAILSFRDPHIIIKSVSDLGLPVEANLEITPDNGSTVVKVAPITLPAATYYGSTATELFWIGEYDPANGYVFAKAENLGKAITEARESIYVSGTGEQGDSQLMFYSKGAQAQLDYTLEIPFAPAKEFYAVTRQTIEDVFDGDIVDYLFQGGTAEIYGTVTNSIPLSFRLEMIVTDISGDPVGITLPMQDIAEPLSSGQASVSEVSFLFSESDMDKLQGAANIDLRFVANGIDDAPALNTADMLILDLKISKTGGIHISSNDDDE